MLEFKQLIAKVGNWVWMCMNYPSVSNLYKFDTFMISTVFVSEEL